MRVLVTGASGFIGRRVMQLLHAKGIEAIGLSRTAKHGFHSGDLRSHHAALLEAIGPSHILHLAWEVTHGSFWTSPDNLLWRDLTIDFAKAAQSYGVARFIGIGTCAEYDWRDGGVLPRREGDALHPATLYGEAKADTFRQLNEIFAQSKTFAWGRLFHLFGRDEPSAKLVRGMIDAAKTGGALPLKAPGVWRDYMNADCAAEAIIALSLSDLTGPVNIATGHAMQLKTIGALIAESLGQAGLYDAATDETGGETIRMIADITRLTAIYDPSHARLTPAWVRANA